MIQEIQTELFNALNITDITSLLGNGSSSIVAASDFSDDIVVPAIVLDYAGGRWINLSNLIEDWFVYVLDRDNGYYRIAGISEEVKNTLHLSTLDLSGDYKCFQVRWLSDAAWGMSRAFKTDAGGGLYRINLSNT